MTSLHALKPEITDELEITHHLGNITNFNKTILRNEHSHPAAYALTSNNSDKIYIGSTRDLYKRMSQHKTMLIHGCHRNKNLQKVFDEDPKFSLTFTQTETKEEATEIEQKLLDNMMPTGRLLNISPDAFVAGKGLILSDEAKELIRQKTIQQFSTQEARDTHSQISKRLWQDPEYRKNHEGRVSTQNQIDIMSKHTTELWQDPEYRNVKRNRRPVIVNGDYYSSLKLASDATNVTKKTIANRIKDTSSEFSDYLYV